MGYETFWFDDQDDVSAFDFSNSLFITEGQVDRKIPKRNDCLYVLHNCNSYEYKNVTIGSSTIDCTSIGLQTYTNYRKTNKNKVIHFDGDTLTMCWATDLLPHEINTDLQFNNNNNKSITWVGTMGGGIHGNDTELNPFIEKATKNGINFYHSDPWGNPISFDENIRLIRESYLAPTIVGAWQKEHNYIPCRIFKNISYGKMGITNSKSVKDSLIVHKTKCNWENIDDCPLCELITKNDFRKTSYFENYFKFLKNRLVRFGINYNFSSIEIVNFILYYSLRYGYTILF
jgi:hypothetical protein